MQPRASVKPIPMPSPSNAESRTLFLDANISALPEDDTVYYDQWDKETKCSVQCRQISLQQELNDGYESSDHYDVARDSYFIRNNILQ